jgi:predicted Zn-dependent protease
VERIEQLRALLAKEPDDVFCNFSLAMELRSTDQIDAALTQFDRVIALDPNYLAAHMRKGETLMKLHRYDEARATLERGAEVARSAGDQHMVDNIQEMLDMLP